MQQRQQLLLQQLGIAQWVAKTQVTHTASMAVLWRDQHDDVLQTSNTDIRLEVPAQQATAKQDTANQAVVQNEQPFIKEGTASQTVQDIVPTETVVGVKHDQQQSVEFNSQILVHDKFVIFVDMPQHDNERRLLSNIQKSCLVTQFTLYWPLQINGWDEQGLFLQSYIQGFLAIHGDKKLISLGEHALLDVLATSSSNLPIIKMASLAQMITSPLLKRDLWQLLYPLISSAED